MAKIPTASRPRPAPATRQADQAKLVVNHQEERHEIFIGPLPHPDILRQYNELHPDFAERLLALTEQEAAHRRRLEQQAAETNAAIIKRGQLFGLTIGVCGLVAATVAAYFNQPWVGGVLGGGTVLGLVSAFVLGRAPRAR